MADSRLKIDIRRNRILSQLRQAGAVTVAELSRELGATPVTIRNDLSALEADGYLQRVKGGAVLSPRISPAPGIQRDAREEEKRSIARSVQAMIRSGDTLFLNSGSTTLAVAAALKEHRNLNIVTNSLAVASELGDVPTFRVLLLGGEINAQYGFTYGGDAQEQLRRYQADWSILSVDGISAEGGVTTYHAQEAILDRMMMEQSKQTLVVADHTKIGRTGFTNICSISPSLRLVTDGRSDPQTLHTMEVLGVAVIQ